MTWQDFQGSKLNQKIGGFNFGTQSGFVQISAHTIINHVRELIWSKASNGSRKGQGNKKCALPPQNFLHSFLAKGKVFQTSSGRSNYVNALGSVLECFGIIQFLYMEKSSGYLQVAVNPTMPKVRGNSLWPANCASQNSHIQLMPGYMDDKH